MDPMAVVSEQFHFIIENLPVFMCTGVCVEGDARKIRAVLCVGVVSHYLKLVAFIHAA